MLGQMQSLVPVNSREGMPTELASSIVVRPPHGAITNNETNFDLFYL